MTAAPATAEIPQTNLASLPITRGRFDAKKVEALLNEVYTPEEVAEMKAAGVDKRMVFGINPHYYSLAIGGGLKDSISGKELLPDMPPSKPLIALVMPRMNEVYDVEGEKDPSNQNRYTADSLKGKILHKYDEIVLGYAAMACSAHCRYCYRLDLFNGSTGKGLVKPDELREYVKGYNDALAAIAARNGQHHRAPVEVTEDDIKNNPLLAARVSFERDIAQNEKRVFYPITEVLLSGGDPMVLTNAKIYEYMAAIAEGGAYMVRIGTKEMAFRPERFDAALAETLRQFHEKYPRVHVNIVTHFTHPDEFLERDKNGEYIRLDNGFKWLDIVNEAVQNMVDLPFVSLENQTPMISRVNDDVQALRRLHLELRRNNIKPKYIFQGREIEGHKAFSVPVEEAWRIHAESQKGVSDTARSRFAMSSEWGKLEIVSVMDGVPEELNQQLPAFMQAIVKQQLGDGFIIFKVHRSPYEAETQSDIVIARRNPKALWISGYEDRILYDGRKKGANRFSGILKLLGSLGEERKAG